MAITDELIVIGVLFTRELAARIPASKVVIDVVNPGFCYSGLRRNAGAKLIVFSILDLIWGNTTEVGGRRIAWAAVARRHCEYLLHGRYTAYMEVMEESDWSLSKEGFAVQLRLWVSILGAL